MNNDLEIGWYGKLPASGDFVSRRIPRSLLDMLDDWLSRGLAEMQASLPDEWRASFAAAPAWYFTIPASVGGGDTLIGLIVPSHDRVGRAFPLCAGIVLPPDAVVGQLLADAHGWLSRLGEVVVRARDRGLPLEEFDAAVRAIALPSTSQRVPTDGGDDILNVLGLAPLDAPTVPMPLAHAIPWPELPLIFDANAATSFWWTKPTAGAPLTGFTTDSGLSPSLLLRLMGPPAARSGELT